MRRTKDLFFENWYLKLFSLALATGLWALLAQESQSEVFFDVPVEYQNVPASTEVISDNAKTVEVRLRGPSSLIREIAAKDISTIIDLKQTPLDGETIVPLNAQHVHVPFGVEVLRVTPARVRVSLEPTVAKRLHITPVPSRIPPGFEVDSIAVIPDSVKVEGPASRILMLTSVMTTPINLSGLSSKRTTLSQTTDLDVQDPLVRFPEATPIRVEVKIRRKQ